MNDLVNVDNDILSTYTSKVSRNEKRTNYMDFIFIVYEIANFELFCRIISLSTNLLLAKSEKG